MLTSYSVKCPGCDWHGSLLPEGAAAFCKGLVPSAPMLEFHCPQCDLRWRARRIGDDVDSHAESADAPLAGR